MEPFTFIWDWNGTLLDDAPLCLSIMNRMLERRGLPLIDGLAAYREIFTFPVEEYYRSAGLDLKREAFAGLAEEYIRLYNQEALHCSLCPGARDVLEQLHDWGVRQVIVSASHQEALEEQVESQHIQAYFSALLGVRDVLGTGKAGLAKAYLQAQNIDKHRVYCVGDTLHDWEVAREMGCTCLLVAQGHQSRQRLAASGAPILDTLKELPAFWQHAQTFSPR